MNFEEAIAAHQKWKSHLRVHINGSSTEMLDPEVVGEAGLCDLGKWIQDEGERILGHKPEFRAMKRTHAHFHYVAAEVLRRSKAGDHHGACLLLDGPFFQASVHVMEALEKCKDACLNGGLGETPQIPPGDTSSGTET